MNAIDTAVEKAREARSNAYAPYSKFKVGVACKIRNENRFATGANVENASYGGTVCAERTAIFSEIIKSGNAEFEFMVILTDMEEPVPPCAFCLQVMAEFCSPDLSIYLANLEGVKKSYLFKELLPHPFTNFIPEESL